MDAEQVAEAAQIEAAVRGPLEALGVERLEVLVRGAAGRKAVYVGYRLRDGAVATPGSLRESVSAHLPAAIEVWALQVCRLEDLPLDDPVLVAARHRILGTRWRRVAVAVLALTGAIVVAAGLLLGRGKLVARAGVYAAGVPGTATFPGGQRLTLWADLRGRYSGRGPSRTLRKILPVHYEIDFLQAGRVVAHLAIDTQVRRPVQTLYCAVAPECEVFLGDVPQLPSGTVEIRVVATPRADVTKVGDLSINVRRPGLH